MAYETIDIEQAKLLVANEGVTVIDIRDRASFESGHIDNAIHVDNNNVEEFIGNADHNGPLLVCCYHGNMSKGAAEYFDSRGFSRAYSLNGGYSGWASMENL